MAGWVTPVYFISDVINFIKQNPPSSALYPMVICAIIGVTYILRKYRQKKTIGIYQLENLTNECKFYLTELFDILGYSIENMNDESKIACYVTFHKTEKYCQERDMNFALQGDQKKLINIIFAPEGRENYFPPREIIRRNKNFYCFSATRKYYSFAYFWYYNLENIRKLQSEIRRIMKEIGSKK